MDDIFAGTDLSGDFGYESYTPLNYTSPAADWSAASPSSSTWGDLFSGANVTSFVQGLNSLAGAAKNVLGAVNAANTPSRPTAGVYNSSGNFMPLPQNTTSVVSPSGKVLTPTVGSQVSGTLSSVFSSLTPYLPWLIVAGVALLAFKLVKKL